MFIEDVDPAAFDAAFFNISRADAVAMDPQQRQLLEVVYECLENGGLTLERLGGENVGTFVGSFMNGEPSPYLPNQWIPVLADIETGRIRLSRRPSPRSRRSSSRDLCWPRSCYSQ